ncbi:hypothetical protein [Yoonia vestfoldensis]|uniref:hypothetical protein n=1 Tax=Yoonia vestfoldensis TaxID=245188 RepID=UPI0012FF6D22|nr:hypothetical protein [Yoonia vestfoldensis]
MAMSGGLRKATLGTGPDRKSDDLWRDTCRKIAKPYFRIDDVSDGKMVKITCLSAE